MDLAEGALSLGKKDVSFEKIKINGELISTPLWKV